MQHFKFFYSIEGNLPTGDKSHIFGIKIYAKPSFLYSDLSKIQIVGAKFGADPRVLESFLRKEDIFGSIFTTNNNFGIDDFFKNLLNLLHHSLYFWMFGLISFINLDFLGPIWTFEYYIFTILVSMLAPAPPPRVCNVLLSDLIVFRNILQLSKGPVKSIVSLPHIKSNKKMLAI